MNNANKLSFGEKLSIGMGEISAVSTRQVISMFLLFYLTDIAGINPAIAGTVYLVGRTWQSVFSPIVGVWSDDTRTKWGRRRPFFIFSAIPLALFFFLLWCPFRGPLAALYYTIILTLFYSALTTYSLPYRGFLAEVTDDYTERQTVVNYRQFFSMFFGLLAAVIPKMIADSFDKPELGWMVMGISVAIWALIFPVVLFKNTKERPELYKNQDKIRSIKDLLIVFNNKLFIYLLIIYSSFLAATNLLESVIIYYLKYSINRYGSMEIIFVIFVLVGIASFPLWTRITKKMGKKKAVILGGLLFIVFNALWLLLDANSPSIYVYMVAGLVGTTYGCSQVIPSAMLPDVVDYDELTSGARREGLYQGVMSLIMMLLNSFSIFLVGLVLSSSGYAADQIQTSEALRAIYGIVVVAPIVLTVPGVIAAIKFPLTKEKHTEIQSQLKLKRK